MNTYTILRSPINLIHLSFRTFSAKVPEPLKYYGFTYYPRHENFQDPPYKPSKLFLIKRLKRMRHLNPKERRALELLNIDGCKFSQGHISIVKNIPEINALLWRVKHLVEIKPITWTGDLPKDCLGTHLRETGELVIKPELKVPEEALTESEKYEKKKFGPGYMKEYLLKQWVTGYSS